VINGHQKEPEKLKYFLKPNSYHLNSSSNTLMKELKKNDWFIKPVYGDQTTALYEDVKRGVKISNKSAEYLEHDLIKAYLESQIGSELTAQLEKYYRQKLGGYFATIFSLATGTEPTFFVNQKDTTVNIFWEDEIQKNTVDRSKVFIKTRANNITMFSLDDHNDWTLDK